MADVIILPTAAAQPVINSKRQGTPPVNVTRRMALVSRRRDREEARQAEEARQVSASAERMRGRLEYVVANATVGLSDQAMQWLYDETVARIAALRVFSAPAGSP